MDEAARLTAAQHQLELVLGFFGRVDSKLSVVLGIDLAMLGVVFARLSILENITWGVFLAGALFSVLLGYSFLQLFRGSFPVLDGGQTSLIYFRSIGKLRESDFLDRYHSLTPAQLADDYLEQTWRNSKILTIKFDCLKTAYVYMAWAALPWSIILVSLSGEGQ